MTADWYKGREMKWVNVDWYRKGGGGRCAHSCTTTTTKVIRKGEIGECRLVQKQTGERRGAGE